MRIGIDIDGVIVDTINFIAAVLTKSYGYTIKPGDVAHRLGEIENINNFFAENGEYLLCTLAPMEKSIEILDRLDQEHEIFLISARFRAYYDLTLNWLNKYGIRATEVLFTEGKSKTDLCKEYRIELFIEDSAINALEIAELNIPVLLVNTEYNQTAEGRRIIRCDNWDEIYDYIKERPSLAV